MMKIELSEEYMELQSDRVTTEVMLPGFDV